MAINFSSKHIKIKTKLKSWYYAKLESRAVRGEKKKFGSAFLAAEVTR